MTDLNIQTDPKVFEKVAFQAWEKHNMTGKRTKIYTTEGFYDLNMTCSSYVWLNKDDSWCVTFCMGPTDAVGYWCDTRSQSAASSNFNRVFIWQGRWSNLDASKDRCQ